MFTSRHRSARPHRSKRLGRAGRWLWNSSTRAVRYLERDLPPALFGAVYAITGAAAWLAVATALIEAAHALLNVSLLWGIVIQVLPLAALIVAWLRLGVALGARSERRYRAFVWAPAWFILMLMSAGRCQVVLRSAY